MRIVGPWIPAPRDGSRVALLVALALALLLALGIVAPALDPRGVLGVAGRVVYAPICHQLDERSLHLGGIALALCARCTGLAAGALIGLALGLVGRIGDGRPKLVALAVAGLPTLVDGAAALAGGGLDDGPRALLALPLGLVAGLLVAEGITDVVTSPHARRSAPAARHTVVPEERHG